jgi:urocanate hydratase
MLVKAMLELQKRGSFVFEFSNNFRQVAFERGLDNAFAIKDIEDIVSKNLLNKDKYNLKILKTSNDKEDLFLINDLIYQQFPDDQELKINSDIFLSLRDINSYYLKIDKEKSVNFIEKINDMVENKEIIAPMILSNCIFEKKDYLTNDNYLFNINSFSDEFKINENCLIIEGKSNFENTLQTMLL